MFCLVLARRDFRESDQIISLYTAEKGKMEALARGVKKITSKNSAFLEPCFLVDAEIIPGKEIMHLTKVQPVNSFKNIRENLQKILIAGYVVDLLDKLLQTGEPDKNTFLLLKSFLEFLDQSADVHPIILDSFVVKLFKLLGFDMSCEEKVSTDLFVPTQGRDPYFISGEIKNLLEYGWPAKEGVEGKIYLKLHRAVHNFAVFHSERKLAYFSEI